MKNIITIMNDKENDINHIIKNIKEVWNETKEHFGNDFPFNDTLNIKIKKKDIIQDLKIK